MAIHLHDSGNDSCCCNTGNCMHNDGPSRRAFLSASGIGLGALAMGGLVWNNAMAAEGAEAAAPGRTPLVVKPVISYDVPQRRPQTSWRNWGGIHTEEAATDEIKRITEDLEKLRASADFPMEVLPVARVRSPQDVAKIEDLAKADAIIHYAAGGWTGLLDAVAKTGKPTIFFIRHRSGPVYLWYEIISPRYLHAEGDNLATGPAVDNDDVVVDSMGEVEWRLRALCGRKNSLGMKVVCIGGADGWGKSGRAAPTLSKDKWKLELPTVEYKELATLLTAAMADESAVKLSRERAAKYLADPLVKLETEKVYVENAFLLEQVFKGIMAKAGARAITVNQCMGAIMPISKTTACMTLSLLNDAGYLAFCESDFVVIPSGILLSSITGRPNFLNDPTYPHDSVITLAHCTAPRKLDGKTLEPVRILTHFESDYGAAPKVEMRKGQVVSNVIPDFAMNRYVGLRATIVDSPFLPICRSQIDVKYAVPDAAVARNMPGFHWETIYGDCLKETGYALRKIGIGWEMLG